MGGWRRGWWLVSLAVAMLARAGTAQLATTTVQDTVYRADGTAASGTVVVSWNAFTTAAGSAVPTGSTTVTLGPGGALAITLAPNAGATPMGSYYTAVFHLNDGSTSREYWVVPVTAAGSAPVRLVQIRNSVLPVSVAMQTVSKGYVDTAIAVAAIRPAQLPVFAASGAAHSVGAVPDPGAVAGATRFLREDATFAVPASGVSASGAAGAVQTAGAGGTLADSGCTASSGVMNCAQVVATGAGPYSVDAKNGMWMETGALRVGNSLIYDNGSALNLAGSDNTVNITGGLGTQAMFSALGGLAVGPDIMGTDPGRGSIAAQNNVSGNSLRQRQGENVVGYSASPVLNGAYLINQIALAGNMSPTMAAGSPGQLPTCLVFVHDATSTAYVVTWPGNVLGGFAPGATANLRDQQCFNWVATDGAWEASSAGLINY